MAELCRALDHEWLDFQRSLGELVRQHQSRRDELVAKYVSSSNERQPEDIRHVEERHPCTVIPTIPDVDRQGKQGITDTECLYSSEPHVFASHVDACEGHSNGSNPFVEALTRNSSGIFSSFREGLESQSQKLSMKLRGRAANLAEIEHGNWLHRTLFRRCRATVEWWIALEEPPRSGRLARFVDSSPFEAICSVMILANAVLAVFAANYEMANLRERPPFVMTILEVTFVSWYTLEIILKFAVHGFYLYVGEFWQWNLFDTFLVLLALYDQILSNMSDMDPTFLRTMRILKVAKISRTVRLLRFFSELRLILKSLMGSLNSLFWSMSMLVLVFYIFALVLVNSVAAHLALNLESMDESKYIEIKEILGSVQQTMLTLYMVATGGDDWAVFYSTIASTGAFNAAVFILYVAFVENCRDEHFDGLVC